MNRFRRLVGLPAVVLALLVGGCTGVPSSTSPVVVGPAPTGDVGIDDIPIEPLGPRDGLQPDEVVRQFLNASASSTAGRPVARQYLTPEAARSWKDDTLVTVIDSNYAQVPSADGKKVTLTGRVIATVTPDGIYSLSSGPLRQDFSLEKVHGQWRISVLQDGVFLANGDFLRTFSQANLYFLDANEQRVVPDPRYFPDDSEKRANTLVQHLIAGPSVALAPAVRTELGKPVAQLSSVVQDGQTVRVELTGVERKSPQQMEALSAQLVWTLRQLRINSVQITNDGEPIDVPGVGSVQSANDWEVFNPDVIPVNSVGHFIDQGAVLRSDDGTRIAGPTGDGTYGLVSAGVSMKQEYLAGVSSGTNSATLWVGPYAEALTAVASARSFTPPTWGGYADEVWTVRDGSEVVRVPVRGSPEVVLAPDLPKLGVVQSMRLSRDNTRVEVVVQVPTGRTTVFVGRVVTQDAKVQLEAFVEITPSLSTVVDACWLDSSSLYVTGKSAGDSRVAPFVVKVDGSQMISRPISGLPGDPSGVAAVAGRFPLASAGDTIWRLEESTWGVLVRGKPPFKGTAPFYPG